MRRLFDLRSYPARLVLGSFVLILLTTLSAGVPAYWLTRTELERQTWSHVASAEHATLSLLRAEQERLDSLIALLAERPTLHHLLSAGSMTGILSYLADFQTQSGLDFLFLCSEDHGAGDPPPFPACPSPLSKGYQLRLSRPAVLMNQPIYLEDAQPPLAVAVAGRWLDEPFLRQLASDTGVAQSILLADGSRVASSIGDMSAPTIIERRIDGLRPAKGDQPSAAAGKRLLIVGDEHYYASRSPLRQEDGSTAFLLEAALPADNLFATRSRALAVLSLSTGAVALLGALAGIWAVRRLSKPLEQLTRSAEAIGDGDLAAPVLLPAGPQEVRTLALALQHSQASMLAAMDDLAQARDWLDSLVQSIVEGVVTLDQAGDVTFINETAAALAAVSVGEALGRPIDDLFPACEESGNRISLRDIPYSRARHRISLLGRDTREARPARHPGERILRRVGSGASVQDEASSVLEVTAARLAAPGSEPAQTALILRDITQEESLRRLRSYFLANITHEFRTPLSALSASMELLLNETDLSPSEMRDLMKPIHLSLLSLRTLIDNLLESSSIEAGRFVLRRQPVDLNQVIADALQLVQPLLERRAQSLSMSEPAFLPWLLGDSARLMQVLVNLLSNASKYSPMHTAIGLTVEHNGATLRLSVIDRGPGISAEEREHIFRRFVRSDDDRSEQYGIGLGLHVVKTTVEVHGGHVGVDPHRDGGSVFWFELPVEQEARNP